jgi:hypothetical protein
MYEKRFSSFLKKKGVEEKVKVKRVLESMELIFVYQGNRYKQYYRYRYKLIHFLFES